MPVTNNQNSHIFCNFIATGSNPWVVEVAGKAGTDQVNIAGLSIDANQIPCM